MKELESYGVNLSYLGQKVADDAILSAKTVVLTGNWSILNVVKQRQN